MSFDDDWMKPVFPTRMGGAVGHSLENKMLGTVGGANSIRTRVQTLPDGSVVMLRTRGGFPEFTVTPPRRNNYTLFTETDYEARTYKRENIYIGGPSRGFSFPFDYVKTIQLFDVDGGECVLTFPDPFSVDCYAPTIMTLPNKFMRFPLSAPKKAELTGTATATIDFTEPPLTIDFFDTTSANVYALSARRSLATYDRAATVEYGISSLIVGDLKFVFAKPVNNL